MQGGDISNGTPPRFLVGVEVIADKKLTSEKRFLRKAVERETLVLDPIMVNILFRFTVRNSCVLDLFGICVPQSYMDSIMDDLDATIVNPFQHSVTYPGVPEMLLATNYRLDVLGVIDLPEYALRYGSRFYSTDNLRF